jgi:transcription antitermination protein NusB
VAKRRHQARRMALQILYGLNYLADANPAEVVDGLRETPEVSLKNWTPFARELTQGVIEHMESLDQAISSTLKNWRIERLSRVDLIILRLALYEMRHCDDIPIRVSLNEYIEVAKEFGTDESSSFINGILDRLAKEFPEKDFQK